MGKHREGIQGALDVKDFISIVCRPGFESAGSNKSLSARRPAGSLKIAPPGELLILREEMKSKNCESAVAVYGPQKVFSN